MEHNQEGVVRFICEGCGSGVIMTGASAIPNNHYCLTCGFVEWAVKGDNTVKQSLHEHLGSMRHLQL